MACNCSDVIRCDDPDAEISAITDSAGYNHTYNQTTTVTNLPFAYSMRSERRFSVEYGWDREVSVDKIVVCGESNTITCGNQASATPHCNQSEDCTIELNTLYYMDRHNSVYIWKNVRENLSWNISSGGKVAKFKLKWGDGYYHKICIPNTVQTHGTETFKMSIKGVETTLATKEYSYNPFPATEGGGATWGLYGNVITQEAQPDTPNVSCILLFPLVPKQAIPQDNDVIAYGFYDYGTVEGGFVESGLSESDGGKDYFYPHWCRSMPEDPIWRNAADTRFQSIFRRQDNGGSTSWNPQEPLTNTYPFGSVAIDRDNNQLISLLLQFGQHADSEGVVYNKSTFGDVIEALSRSNVPLNTFTKFDPVTPL